MENFENVEVIGEEYPLPPIRKFLSYYVTTLQIILFGLLFCSGYLKPYFTQFVKEDIYKAFEENKFGVGLFIFLIGNILGSLITNTGAMEMYLDGKLIWSKLETGNVMHPKELAKILANRN